MSCNYLTHFSDCVSDNKHTIFCLRILWSRKWRSVSVAYAVSLDHLPWYCLCLLRDMYQVKISQLLLRLTMLVIFV